ncbi:MAG: hypothetical protein DI498_01970 [Paracoccus denitrificans]|nr:MAG: hypothetical protein DI498_01970 [Paracoccus denitrificans]PZO85925.1 MAG: hypothetical protein DI633_01970 [Paracoccus denitrificans]
MTAYLFLSPNVVFIHVPGNAGTSIRSAFPSLPVARVSGPVPTGWPACPSFAVVRHPVERFLSAVNLFRVGFPAAGYHRRGARLPGLDAEFALDILQDASIDPLARGPHAALRRHLLPQTDPLNDLAHARTILRHETLDADLAAFIKPLGISLHLPRLRPSADVPHLLRLADLSEPTMARLEQAYAADFETLGYTARSLLSHPARPPTKVAVALVDVWPSYFDDPLSDSTGGAPLLPPHDADLGIFIQTTVPGPGKRTSPKRRRNLTEHFRFIEPEFAGRARIGHLLACSIAVLRRHPDDAEALSLFLRITRDHGAAAAEAMNSRWLTSVCDTFMEYGTPAEAAAGLAGSILTNLNRLHETERAQFYPHRPWPPKTRFTTFGALHDGVNQFWLAGGDAMRNLHRRAERALADENGATPFLRALMDRFRTNNTVIARAEALQGQTPLPLVDRDMAAELKRLMRGI